MLPKFLYFSKNFKIKIGYISNFLFKHFTLFFIWTILLNQPANLFYLIINFWCLHKAYASRNLLKDWPCKSAEPEPINEVLLFRTALHSVSSLFRWVLLLCWFCMRHAAMGIDSHYLHTAKHTPTIKVESVNICKSRVPHFCKYSLLNF